MSRLRAASIHFGISVAIIVVLAGLMVFVWYPDFFFYTDGGAEGMRLIVLVGLVLGPVLTFIVFKSGKPSLRFDLTVIAFIQTAALTAGTYVVWSERPLALVLVDGHFESLSADDYREVGMDVPDLDSFPGNYPKWLVVDLPSDPAVQSRFRASMYRTGRRLALASEYYIAYTPARLPADEATPIEALRSIDGRGVLTDWSPRCGASTEDCLFFRYAARYRYEYLGFDGPSRELIGVLRVPVLAADAALPQPSPPS